MPFITETTSRRKVEPYGNPNSKIAIVGDFSDGYDERTGRPFSGPSGTVLEQCLHAAGIIRGEVYTTNVVLDRVDYSRRSKYFDEKKCTFTALAQPHIERLRNELEKTSANVLVAAGSLALSAIANLRYLSKYRGYVFVDSLLGGTRKVIPIHHPFQTIRGMYTYRYMIVCDLKKAKMESQFRELKRPQRQLIYRYDTVEEALEWLDYYSKQDTVGFDIEVINYEVSCISFSSSPDIACVIPIADRWSLEEELLIWRGIQKVLSNPRSQKVVQNGMFDIPFLLTRNGVEVKGSIHDTMVAHSIMYPDLPKGLGFLGSIYCGSQQYWKDTVKFSNIKDES
jgi:uracil-DNA glycosylase family 4